MLIDRALLNKATDNSRSRTRKRQYAFVYSALHLPARIKGLMEQAECCAAACFRSGRKSTLRVVFARIENLPAYSQTWSAGGLAYSIPDVYRRRLVLLCTRSNMATSSKWSRDSALPQTVKSVYIQSVRNAFEELLKCPVLGVLSKLGNKFIRWRTLGSGSGRLR